MKVSKWAILLAMASGLGAATAFGQSGLRQPGQVAPAGFEYGSYDYYAQEPAPSPSDAPAPPPPAPNGQAADMPMDAPAMGAPAAAGTCDTCGTDAACGCEECKLECPEACEPWRLFDCDHLKCHGISVRGWVNGGYMWNADDPASRFNGPTTFADRDEPQFNQGYLILEKAIDPQCGCWDLGGRVDLLYGSDYRFTLARGLDAHDDFTARWNDGNSRFYGTAMPQAYAQLGNGTWDFKVGHFYTIIGYEVVTAPDNFFYTHAYTMQYGEPFTHTGALATYEVNEQLSVSGGFTRGWDAWEDNNEDLSALYGFTLTSEDEKASLAYYAHVGDEDDAGNLNRYINSVVFTYALTDDWKYVFHHDYGFQEEAAGPDQDGEWYSFNHYLFYTVNDCLSYGLRYEWFSDDDGTRVTQLLPDDAHTLPIAGVPTHWQEITFGANYKPHANVVVRPEARFDWADPLVDDPDYSVGPENGSGPYDDFSDRSQFTLGTDVIVTF